MYDVGVSIFSEESSRGHCQTIDTGLDRPRVSTSIFNHRPKSLRGVKEVLMVPQGLTNLYLEREKQYKEKVQNGIYLGTQDKPSEVTEPPPPSKPAICK